MSPSPREPSSAGKTGHAWIALAANVPALLAVAWVAVVEATDPDLYYRNLQEDEALEWATFWAFALAAAVGVWVARRMHRAGTNPWFPIGVALFCVFVAGEEISWGQRLLAYRPPVYFLEHNFQQELNVHNVISTDWRQFALKAVILGYGVVLPLLALASPAREWFRRLTVVVPPLGLAPTFLASFIIIEAYPWRFSGEITELLLGFGFLFAALETGRRLGAEETAAPVWRRLVPVAAAWLLAVGLGVATAEVSRARRSADPAYSESALQETEALRRDFLALAAAGDGTKCGTHKRVYSWVEKYERDELFSGEFAALEAQGLPEERAAFFLDPWNLPYWVRHRCKGDREVVLVYSFGANRRRDSSRWEIVPDDVGAVIVDKR